MSASAAATDDHDGDGIVDASDRCPDEPEDFDRFEDGDGCVDRDNDGDGIVDAHEFRDGVWTNCDYMRENGVDVDCRDRPEDIDGVEDHDGCPDVLCLDSCQIKLSARLHFDRRGRFADGTKQLLDEVAAVMRSVPEVSFYIDAHTDAGRAPRAAADLTARLATDTVDALVQRGVARERLTPRGLGDAVPVAPHRSAAERAADRRVEFTLTNCGSCGRPPGLSPALRAAAGLPPEPDPGRPGPASTTCR